MEQGTGLTVHPLRHALALREQGGSHLGESADAPGVGTSRTPLQDLDGMITPSGLHFERHHSGIPDIDPDQHRLLIHGMVRRPLVFTLDNLSRYPRTSRIAFVECAGNSRALNAAQPAKANIQLIHGLLSCSDWTGVKLSTLLDEVGVDPAATWVIAEGADSSGMSRSFPSGYIRLHHNQSYCNSPRRKIKINYGSKQASRRHPLNLKKPVLLECN